MVTATIGRQAGRDAEAGLRSVYIVEDSDSIRARLVDMLSDVDGLRIVGEAADAPGAVAGILQSLPDAVVLDIQLADSSGLDVLRTVHARAPDVIFIMLTNYPNPQYRRICMQSGASHFLDKTSEFGRVADLLRHPAPPAMPAAVARDVPLNPSIHANH
jgi:DNA-binding NarL/FixJ family response regulator